MKNFFKSIFISKDKKEVKAEPEKPQSSQATTLKAEIPNSANEQAAELHVKLAGFADDYYLWTNSNPDGDYEKYTNYNEVRSIGEQLFKTGGKRKMLNEYSRAKNINPQKIWVISKMWNRIGNPYGDMEDIWLD